MSEMIIRRWWLGMLGLVWLGATSVGHAWERPNVKIDAVFDFRFDVQVGPPVQRPTAPWYAYFPNDPNINPSPQATPFPPWPMQFPPPGPPADAYKKTNVPSNVPAGPMQTSYWPVSYSYGSNLQPVGYAPMQAPSYWYRQR